MSVHRFPCEDRQFDTAADVGRWLLTLPPEEVKGVAVCIQYTDGTTETVNAPKMLVTEAQGMLMWGICSLYRWAMENQDDE